jgi:rod shape-determining protein MreD
VKPELMLMVIASWSLLRGTKEGLVWAFIGGICLDLLSGVSFGMMTIALLTASFIAGLGESSVFRTHIVLPLVVALTTTLVYDLVILVVLDLTGHPVVWLDSLTRITVPSAVVNALFMPLVFWPLQWLHRKTGREEMRW